MAVEGMNDSRGRWEAAHIIDEQLRETRVGAGAQVSLSFPASSLGDVIAGGSKDNGFGLGL
jgi:hypothetical protein